MTDVEGPDSRARLSLRIPEPAIRRGKPLTSADLHMSRAGEARRPAVDESFAAMASMPEQMIRVLAADGRALGPWAGTLSDDDLVVGLRDMMLVRSFDSRMLRAHRQGKISFYMQCLGEEAIACAQRRALSPKDMAFPTYRQQGLLIAREDIALEELVCQLMSNARDPMRGRQLPVMYSYTRAGC